VLLFAESVDKLLRSRNESRAELARALGITDAYVTKLLNEKKPPPDPSATDLYHKLNRHFGQPDGHFERLALEDRLGRPMIDNVIRAHTARQLLRENYRDHPEVRKFLDSIDTLPDDRQLQLIELLARLSLLPAEKITALEQLFLPSAQDKRPAPHDQPKN